MNELDELAQAASGRSFPRRRTSTNLQTATIALLVLGVLLTAGVVAWIVRSDLPALVGREASANDRISAVMLMDVYQRNALQADREYGGRRLVIAGTVQGVGRDDDGRVFVALRTKTEGRFVRVYMRPTHLGAAEKYQVSIPIAVEAKVPRSLKSTDDLVLEDGVPSE